MESIDGSSWSDGFQALAEKLLVELKTKEKKHAKRERRAWWIENVTIYIAGCIAMISGSEHLTTTIDDRVVAAGEFLIAALLFINRAFSVAANRANARAAHRCCRSLINEIILELTLPEGDRQDARPFMRNLFSRAETV